MILKNNTLKCLFEPVASGYFYGSDGLRSPLTVGRDPGTPEYEGEENPDPVKYSPKGPPVFKSAD